MGWINEIFGKALGLLYILAGIVAVLAGLVVRTGAKITVLFLGSLSSK